MKDYMKDYSNPNAVPRFIHNDTLRERNALLRIVRQLIGDKSKDHAKWYRTVQRARKFTKGLPK